MGAIVAVVAGLFLIRMWDAAAILAETGEPGFLDVLRFGAPLVLAGGLLTLLAPWNRIDHQAEPTAGAPAATGSRFDNAQASP